MRFKGYSIPDEQVLNNINGVIDVIESWIIKYELE